MTYEKGLESRIKKSETQNNEIRYSDAIRIRKDLVKEYAERMQLSSNAELVLREVYTRRLEDGSPENPYERFAAVAVDVASAEMKYLPESMSYEDKLKVVEERARTNMELYASNKFRANTPTNINMGRYEATFDEDGNHTGYKLKEQMGSACFVIPVEDTFGRSIENLEDGILNAYNTQQLLHKWGGGTGFSFCELRPAGSKIGYNAAIDGIKSIDWSMNRGVSSGYKSFLEKFFDPATDAVKQGNTRRGANMGIQRIDHMDFLDHIYLKYGKEGKIKNFNLSLAATDEFMEAALKDGTYTLYNPHRAKKEIKRILEKKFNIKNPELVRASDLATKEQFRRILEKNKQNPFAPITTPNMYLDDDGKTVINAYNGEKIGFVVDGIVRIEAKKVLELISEAAFGQGYGEPALIFIDRINENNALLFHKEIDATNPCGEQPLLPYEACNLGSINVGAFVKYKVFDREEEIDKKILATRHKRIKKYPDGKIGISYFDFDELEKTIRDSVRFLDNVIDRSTFPSKKIDEAVRNTRKIGLGYMGVADAFVLLGLKYGSKESLEFAEVLAKKLHDISLEESEKLAKERGVFPLWEKSFYNPSSEGYKWKTSNPKRIPDRFRGSRELSDLVQREQSLVYGKRVRNACRISQAPTGTIRRTVGTKLDGFDNLAISSGIEPLFSLIEESNILNSKVKDYSFSTYLLLKREGLEPKEIFKAIEENGGSAKIYKSTPESAKRVLQKIPEEIRSVLVTAFGGSEDSAEIDLDDHIKMQSIFQKYNDSATSKTINLPSSSTKENLSNVWIELWKRGNKGGTIYIDKSRSFQIINTTEKKKEENEKKFKRTLVQKSITIEFPYTSSKSSHNKNQGLNPKPESCFTTITYDTARRRLTGVFQASPETNIENLSNRNYLLITTSKELKSGRSLDSIIEDLEKIKIEGGEKGIVIDEGVLDISKSGEIHKHKVIGGTSIEALLYSLYIMRFLTGGGKNITDEEIEKNFKYYLEGRIPIRSIINQKGYVTFLNNEMPSILESRKKITYPKENENLCPECI